MKKLTFKLFLFSLLASAASFSSQINPQDDTSITFSTANGDEVTIAITEDPRASRWLRRAALELQGSSRDLTGPIPSAIGNLGDILTVDLSDNKLSGQIPTEIGDLSNLGVLNLNCNQLTIELNICEAFTRLHADTMINFSFNLLNQEVIEEGLARLKAHFGEWLQLDFFSTVKKLAKKTDDKGRSNPPPFVARPMTERINNNSTPIKPPSSP